jgi:hypothetical protein
MLDIHAAWSDSLCCSPNGTRWNSGSFSSRSGSKSSGTIGWALTARKLLDELRAELVFEFAQADRALGEIVADHDLLEHADPRAAADRAALRPVTRFRCASAGASCCVAATKTSLGRC